MLLSGSIVALITPFKQGAVDFEAMSDLIKWHLDQGTHGLVVCGSTGEGMLLSMQERNAILKCAHEIIQKRIPIILGCTSVTLEGIKELIDHSEYADVLLITPPPYVKPSQRAIYEYYKMIVGYTDKRIIVYNNQARCGVDISVNTLLDIFQLPNIIGLKDSSMDISRLIKMRPMTDKILLCGEDIMMPAYLLHGGDGSISICGNLIPSMVSCLYKSKCYEEIKKLTQKVMKIVAALNVESNPLPIKYALSLKNKCYPDVRLPLVQMDAVNKKYVEELIKHCSDDCQNYFNQQESQARI